jgi:hypothetical protein
VIALVIIGFMVMLRRRLDPKTVVTATNSLPRFAIALVLIVFSFAIAGLFIDFIFISVGLVRSYFGDIFGGLFAAYSSKIGGGEFVWFPIFTAFSFGTAFNWQAVICSPISLFAGPGIFGLLILILLIEIFLRLILLVVGIYLFWVLIKNYAYMVLFTIFAPLMFLLGAIPGFESVTTNWFKRMFVNTIAFPIILFLIYVAMILIGSTALGGLLEGQVKAPPPIDGQVLNIAYFIGMGMIFFATKVPQFLEKLFKLDSFDIKGGLGAGVLAAPITVPLAGLKKAGDFGKTLSGLQQLGNSGGKLGRAASNAFFRAGYERSNPVPVTDAAGNVTHFEGQEGVAKTGAGATVARMANNLIPGRIASRESKNPGTYRISLERRNNVIANEIQKSRDEGRDFNYAKISREVGEVTPADVRNIDMQSRVRVDISNLRGAGPNYTTPEREENAQKTAKGLDEPSK